MGQNADGQSDCRIFQSTFSPEKRLKVGVANLATWLESWLYLKKVWNKPDFRFVDDLCAIKYNWFWEKLQGYLSWKTWKKKTYLYYKHHSLTYQYILSKISLSPLHMTKGIFSYFQFSASLTVIVICNLKYFMHPLPLKFFFPC